MTVVSRLGALLLLALTALSTGCRSEEAQRVQDEALLIGLGEARAWQRRADLHLQEGDINAAIADVREVLSIALPREAPETEDARLDARARLAQLLIRGEAGGAEAETQAIAEIEAGRREATRDSFYRAHLESVLAEVYEARAKRLTEGAAQKEARQLALKALERAIEIDRRLMKALYGRREGNK